MGNAIFSWFYDYNLKNGEILEGKFGKICGKTYTFHNGLQVSAFLGVPFARNGTFEDRFKKPFPAKKWDGVKDCTRFGPRSIQGDLIWDYFITPIPQSESDCLNMCIFKPNWQSKEFPNGRPVMVFVHGGGFLIHSAANYGDWNICRNLCLHDVVVCTIQYRLGLLGFLSTADENCQGNFGLWDQIAAFQWIKENISVFGGDPNNITAFGQSAGAASLDFLSISPEVEDLFQRVILMGGNANGDWALSTPERTLKATVKMARKKGFKGTIDDKKELLDFLKKQSSSNLASTLLGKSAFNREKNGLDYCPVIDGNLLPESIPNLRKKAKKICAIIGTANSEALLFHALGRTQSDIKTIKKFISINIDENYSNYKQLRAEAYDLYMANVNVLNSEQISRAFINLYSDILMNNATQKYCEEMVLAGHTVYRYNMTYFNPDSFGFFAYRMPFLATHCHDLRYLLGKGLYAKFRPNCDDMKMLNIFTTFWTNFAKYGNPNSKDCSDKIWKKITKNDFYSYFELDLEPKMSTNYQNKRYEFWKKVYANKI